MKPIKKSNIRKCPQKRYYKPNIDGRTLKEEVTLKVNDMMIKGEKTRNGRYAVTTYHEGKKIAGGTKNMKAGDFAGLLNAYVKTARTKVQYNRK